MAMSRGNPEERRHSQMREYELLFVVHPEQDENAFKEIVERVKSWITDKGGEVTKTDLWGKRKLAYSIRKQTEGQYVLLQTKMTPEFCSQLERNLRFLEPVMRFQLVAK
jgi:small subunit ribosomal protein S6